MRSYSSSITALTLIYLVFAAALTVLDGSLFFLYFYEKISFLLFLLSHLGLILIALSPLFRSHKPSDDRRMPIFVSLMFITIGPWGSGIATLSLFLYLFYSTTTSSDWLEDIFDEQADESSLLYERIVYGMEDLATEKKIVSFQDIATFGTEKQKRSSIEKMLKYFLPQFFPILLELLNDRSNSVRVHAATAITRLDKQYFEKYQHLEQQMALNPNNPDKLLDLAHHCKVCLDSRIFDESRQHRFLQTAILAYMEYLQIKPEDFSTYLAFAELHLKNHDPLKAKEVIEKYFIHKQPTTPAVAKLWMQALYALKDYEQLRSFCRNTTFNLDVLPKDKAAVEHLSLWSSSHA